MRVCKMEQKLADRQHPEQELRRGEKEGHRW